MFQILNSPGALEVRKAINDLQIHLMQVRLQRDLRAFAEFCGKESIVPISLGHQKGHLRADNGLLM